VLGRVLPIVGVGLLAAAIVVLLTPASGLRVAVKTPLRAPGATTTSLPGHRGNGGDTTAHQSGGAVVAADHAMAPGPIAPGVQIQIPSIGVDAPVISLGLNSDGSLEVPTDFADAGWWSGGPFPGQPGPAVVVGHVSSVAGPGVFYYLGNLTPGDQVVITRPTGWRATFAVTRLVVASKTQFPTQLVYGPVQGAQLRLITCAGTFDISTGHFVDDLIVFADRISMTS
jgi:sortase (surface protein transpeptidase)